jgi:XisH protein
LRDPERKLFLAVPKELFATFFQADLVQYTLKRNQVAIIVYDVEDEVIVQWIP